MKLFVRLGGLLFLFFVFSTQIVYGIDEGYALLAPATGLPTGSVTLVPYLKGLFTLTVGLAIVLAVIMMVIGGFEYVSLGKAGAGRQKINDAAIGLLVLLSATILLRTLNPDLLNVGFKLTDVAVTEGGSSGSGTSGGPGGQGNTSSTNTQGNVVKSGTGGNISGFEPLTNDQAAARLNPGVKIAGQSAAGNATSLNGTRTGVIDAVNNLQAGCNCNIVITSGTDGTHSTTGNFSHSNGYKVDLRATGNPQLDSYIKNNYTQTGSQVNWGGVKADIYKSADGKITYAREPNHWDVQVKP